MKIKQLLMDKISNYLKNKQIIVIIWLVTVFFSSLITITDGFNKLVNIYNSHFGVVSIEYSKLSKLKPNVHISFIEQLIGSPTLIQSEDFEIITDQDKKERETLKEYVFIRKNYYVQAITNSDGVAISVAITSRNFNFKPVFYRPGQIGNNKAKIILNETTFNTFDSTEQASCKALIGARRFNYYEEYYEANPGNYQSVIISYNDAGYSPVNLKGFDKLFQDLFIDDKIQADKQGYITCDLIIEFRDNTVNTVIFTAPSVNSSDINKFWLGPNLDVVRVIDSE